MFESIRLYPWASEIRVIWYTQSDKIDETPGFYVEKSTDGKNTWERLNPSDSVDGFYYHDNTFSTNEISDATYYRVVMSTEEFGEELSDPVSLVGDSVRTFRIMARLLDKEKVYAEQPVIGSKGELIRRRTLGKKCTDCRDPVTDRNTNPDCSTCKGTGIVGGYYPGLQMYTVYQSLEAYRKGWRELSGSFSSDTRAVRFPAIGSWIEGDRWKDNNTSKEMVLTSEFSPSVSMQGIPIIFTGLIDKVESS